MQKRVFSTHLAVVSVSVFVLGVGRLIHAQGPTALTDLVKEAIARNPDLIALRQQIEVTRQRPAQARALDPPIAEATIWQWPVNTLNPTNTNMYMFMLGQTLPGRGKRDLRAAVAEQDAGLAEADVAIRTQQVVTEVKREYAALYIARRAIEVHRASVDLLRQIADVSQAKYTTGRISQQDVLKPVVELTKLHADLIMFDEQAHLAAARLNTLLDRPTDSPIAPLLEPAEEMRLPGSADLQQMAIEHQPALRKARLDIARAEAELASARGEYAPDITVQGGYMLLPNQTDGVLARVGVTWPRAPWSRSKTDAHVAELTAAVGVAKARARAMENTVRLAVEESYVRALSARERATLVRTTLLPQADQALQVSRIAYEADRVDFQTLIDNQRTLLDAQLDYVRAQSEFMQALANVEGAVGFDVSTTTH
jgi:cobalt-zinc-cadmium efflux system outer membrane protein